MRAKGRNQMLTFCLGALLLLPSSLRAQAEKENKPGWQSRVAVRGNTVFALNLYQQLNQEDGNLFFSPYSISTALSMTYGGARGETARQMAEALHFSLVQKQLHPAFASVQAELNAIQKKGQVKLAVANSIFPHRSYTFRDDYLDLVQKNYGTEIVPVDYVKEPEVARQTINRWVENKTNDKIQDLIPEGVLNELTRMVLANAIYFKGNWSNQFDKKFTRSQPFKVAAGKSVPTPMMFQRRLYPFFVDQENGLQVLELPYEGDEVSMVLLLPSKPDGLVQLEKKLTVKNLKKWLVELRPVEVEATIPKFKMTAEFSLAEPMKSLGMRDAFVAGKADFSGLDGSRDLSISAILHKAFVDVNEEGSEAAAATAVVIRTRSARRYPRFRADHPFIFLIRDKVTGSILFMGRYAKPTPK